MENKIYPMPQDPNKGFGELSITLENVPLKNINEEKSHSLAKIAPMNPISNISAEKTKLFLDETHPRTKTKQEFTLGDVYDFTVGSHNCLSSDAKQDVEKYGVAVTLYFRLLKTMGNYLLIFTILSFP